MFQVSLNLNNHTFQKKITGLKCEIKLFLWFYLFEIIEFFFSIGSNTKFINMKRFLSLILGKNGDIIFFRLNPNFRK